MKTVDELLRPRYKVIADYPDSKLNVGSMITMWRFDDVEKEFFDNGHTLESFYQAYPHLFRKLEWWEERTEDEMPEYVKDKRGQRSKVIKIDKWYIDENMNDEVEVWADFNKKSQLMLMWAYEPATEEEYLQQKK